MLFLSHSGADSAAAKELARRLREAGLEVWLDLDDLHPGDAWMAKLEEALQQASAFAVYVGSSGIQRWVDREVRVALERSTADPSFRIIPILGEGAADLQTLPYFLRQHQAVDFRREISPAELKRLIGAILASPSEAVSLLPPGTAPFRGLEYFDVEHAHLFYGRDTDTQELLEKLRADRFLAVVGASGSGKSSLVRAGLIPMLHRGRFQDGGSLPASWRTAICRPGNRPLRALATALPDLDPEMAPAERIRTIGECARQLEQGAEGLEACVAALVPRGNRTLLLVDQFEEVFTLTSAPEERRQFIDTLLGITESAGDRPVHVLIALRADFYSRSWEHPELPGRIARNQHATRPLQRAQLREVIEKPLAMAGASFKSGLVDRILNEAGDEPGSLALVEHALLQLWERRQGKVLTHAAYEEIGGVSGALAHHANEVFDRLSEDERQIAQKIFLRLTHPGEGSEDTRRRASHDEIVSLGSNDEVAEQVLTSLAAADARLVVTHREGENNVVEVAHEALIREWPRLRRWIDANREALRIERRLIAAAAEWVRTNKDPDALLRGAQLVETQEWAQQHLDDMRPQEQEFLEASIEARDRAIREAEERRQRELDMARQLAEEAQARVRAEKQATEEAEERAREAVARAEAERRAAAESERRAELERQAAEGARKAAENAREAARRNKRLARILAAAAVAAVIFAGAAIYQASQAARRAGEAESRQLAAASQAIFPRDPSEALLLAIRATSRSPTLEAVAALRRSLTAPTLHAMLRGHEGWVSAAAFSPDGRLVVTAGEDGTARLWDVQTGSEQRVLRGHEGGISAAAFSPDSRWIVVTGNSAARLWDVQTGSEHRVLRGHEGWVSAAAFSPDGRWVVTAGTDGIARLWHVETGEERRVLEGHQGGIYTAAFSPDGRLVVTAGGDVAARLWDVQTGREHRAFRAHEGWIYAAAFSPDGKQVLTAGDDGTARLWDLQTGREHRVLEGHAGRIYSVAFSPDGRRVISGGRDRTARLWDVQTGREQSVLWGHEGEVNAAAFSPDGQQVVTAGADGTGRLWNLQTGSELRVFRGHEDVVDAAAFSPDGQRIVTASRDNTARLWTVQTGSELRVLHRHGGRVRAAAFSPDGRRVVTGGEDGAARLWDVQTGELQMVFGPHEGWIRAAAFSPDGRFVVTAGGDGAARLWTVQTGREQSVLHGHDGQISAAAFSRDGRFVVTVGADDSARLWNVRTGEVQRVLRGHEGAVSAAAFSPDGRRVVTAGWGGTARLWDVQSGEVQRVLRRHEGFVYAAAFSPDGRRVVTAGVDSTARLWDAATGEQQMVLRGHESWVSAAAFSPDGRLVLTAGGDGTARLFPIHADHLLEVARARLPVTLAPAVRDTLLGKVGRGRLPFSRQ